MESLLRQITQAGLIGVASSFFLYTVAHPIYLGLANVQVAAKGAQKTVTSAVRHIGSKEGLRGLYKGYLPGLLYFGLSSATGAAFASFATHRIRQAKLTGQREQIEEAEAFANIAGTLPLLVPFLLHPLNVIQTRMMVDHLNGPEKYYQDVGSIIKHIRTSQGIAGFYRGLVPTFWGALSAIAGSAIAGVGIIVFGSAYSDKMDVVAPLFVGLAAGSAAFGANPFAIASKQFQVWDNQLPDHMRPTVMASVDLRSQPRTWLTLKRNVSVLGFTRGLFRGFLGGLAATWLMGLPMDFAQKLSVRTSEKVTESKST